MSHTNGRGDVETTTYNPAGLTWQVTNGRGKTRTYAYTVRGDLQSSVLPDGTTETFTYNAEGQPSGRTDGTGATVLYAYDPAGRLTTVDYPVGTDTSFAYNSAARVSSMVDATGTTSWTYDSAGRVTGLAQPQGTLTYTYDLAGQRTAQSGAGQSQTWTYDAVSGRLSSMANGFGESTSLTYDAAGRLSRKTFASGQVEDFTYDGRSRLSTVTLRSSGGATLRAQSYAYDASSKVTSHTVNGVVTSYTYDGAGQLLTESRPGYSASYTYDGNGNRLTRTVNGVVETFAYDDGDKLLSVSIGGSPVKTYGYDAAGRTTSVVSSSGTTSIAYDFEGRATSISGPGVNQTNVYNGLDTRVGSTTSSVTRTFLRNGAYVTDPVLKDGAATYTPGISERRGTATTYLHSGLKNADAQTSALGALTGTRQYDAFGNVASSTGSWSGPFGYAGGFGYQEDATGLRLLGHRLYDASTGRFLTRDPIKDGRNWYVYCGNDSIRYSDPTGLLHIGGMEFTVDVVAEGLTTGLHGAASGITLGLYDGGNYQNKPGFGFCQGSGKVAAVAIAAAAMLKAVGVNMVAHAYPNTGGGGAQLLRYGKPTGWRFDFHRWKGQPRYKMPHYHRPPKPGMKGQPGEGMARHRPWEGW